MREGASQTAVPLTLQSGGGDKRTFMVNGAPILDGQARRAVPWRPSMMSR